jgi:hypothetical protein
MDRHEIIKYMNELNFIFNGSVNRNISRNKEMLKIFNEIPLKFHGKTKSETIYRFLKNIDSALKCECGRDLTFVSYKKGYNEKCSECRYSDDRTKKIKKTKLQRYGNENFVNVEKAEQTKLERYGNENFVNVEKAEQTKLERYGDKYPNKFGSENFKNSMINTYGVEHNTQIEGFFENRKNRCLEKYGVEHHMQIESIKKRVKETNIEKYGVENALLLESSRSKAVEALIEKYGADNPSKSKSIRKKTNETIRKNTYKKYSQLKTVEALFNEDDYVNNNYKNKYTWRCKKCETVFEDDIFAGRPPRCPMCFPIMKYYSHGENEIAEFLQNYTTIERHNRKIISPQELDIYIPYHNLAIEFNGLYWHSELQGKDRSYHLNKTLECENKGIRLIHIFEDEWIHKQNIVESILLSQLGIYQEKIGARKCEIHEVTTKESKSFFNKNHIQGESISSVNIGLYYNDQLVSVLSVVKSRYNKSYQWEIARFSSKLNHSISGSFSRLFKFFIKNYDPYSIITYSDRRFFSGKIYEKYFNKLNPSGPSYWYLDSKFNRINRTNFQKHRLNDKLHIFNEDLTEWENMQMNGYNRIWDCGNHVFEWRKN